MANRRLVIGAAAVAAVVTGWALFRPELLFVTNTVNETLPGAAQAAGPQGGKPVALLAGSFRDLAHETRGKATIHTLEDGSRVLRLTEFETSNGPDVRIYLVAAVDAPDNATVKKACFRDLGGLKGTQGDQNYTVPADLDLEKYRAVTVWCRRFGVNFGSAALRTGGLETAAR